MSRRKTMRPGYLAVVLGIVLLVLVLLVLLLPGSEEEAPETTKQTTASSTQTEPTVSLPELELPLELEGGLVMESLFQYSGVNPDAENRKGEDIAAATLKNTSDAYLRSALVTVVLTDGNVVTFEVTDLPAGATVMAFSREQASMDAKTGCHTVECTASYGLDTVAIPEQVTLTVTGATIALTNQSDQPLTNLVISCHDILGTEYFGGVTYQYMIENIPAHETVTLEALDSVLGMVDVVRVAMKHE